jgi:hypothetical protein
VDSGVGDDDVQSTQLSDPTVNCDRHGLEVAHVGQVRHAMPTPTFDVLQLIGGRRDIECDHVGALVGKALTVGASGAPSGTGDESDLVRQSRHRDVLIRLKPL